MNTPSALPGAPPTSSPAPKPSAPTPATLISVGSSAPVPTTTASTTSANSPPQTSPEVPFWGSGGVMGLAGALIVAVITTLFAQRRLHIEIRERAAEAKRERDHSTMQAAEDRMHSAGQAALEREVAGQRALLDLRHHADEAQKERISVARRALYLDAVQEFSGAQAFIGGLANQDLSKLDFGGGMGRFFSAVNKVSIIGSDETVAKARELATLMSEEFAQCLKLLAPIAGPRGDIAFHTSQIAAAQAEIDRILASMRNHNETMKNDRPGFEALGRSFDTEQARRAGHAEKLDAATKAAWEIQRQFMLYIPTYTAKLAPLLDTLVVSMRSDLGMDTHVEKFAAHSEEIRARMAKVVLEALDVPDHRA